MYPIGFSGVQSWTPVAALGVPGKCYVFLNLTWQCYNRYGGAAESQPEPCQQARPYQSPQTKHTYLSPVKETTHAGVLLQSLPGITTSNEMMKACSCHCAGCTWSRDKHKHRAHAESSGEKQFSCKLNKCD